MKYLKNKIKSCCVIFELLIVILSFMIIPNVISENIKDDVNFIKLEVGWNMVSIPIQESLNKNNLTINYEGISYSWTDITTNNNPTGEPIILDCIYNWNKTTQTYDEVIIINPGDAFWIFTYYECSIEVEITINGSGTKNFISKFQDPKTLVDSIIFENNSKIGIGTTKPDAKLDVEVESGGAATIGGPGNIATGEYAIAFGFDTIASGPYSTALGDHTIASGLQSFSAGWLSEASGICSNAMGINSFAIGLFSTAIGCGNSAEGEASIAMGYNTKAYGQYSTALGFETESAGKSSVALGSNTKALGNNAISIGTNITVNGDNSVGIGLDNSVVPYEIYDDRVMSIMGGNVGIGTTSPKNTLHINGTIQLDPTDEPATPSTGFVIYCDLLDGKLKAKSYKGTITDIAGP